MRSKKTILVTGGAGFIGSALIRRLMLKNENKIVNVDKLTYSGNLQSLKNFSNNSNYIFEQIDICDSISLKRIFSKNKPDLIFHLAAESHVDRSIDSPLNFIQSNIFGTFSLLEASRNYWQSLRGQKKNNFRFLHVSTDEVYGDLGDKSDHFSEDTAYNPSSPYAATKASSDHLVNSWHRTYGLPTLITNCSNNYGPYQFPEKLIPHIILNALKCRSLPIYGNGKQIRDWLYVDDHIEALMHVASKGNLGETYNIGGNNEIQNIEVVKKICYILDEVIPIQSQALNSYEELITFVNDRPGHDTRYAINSKKIESQLGWKPKECFDTGILKTVNWYLNNNKWLKDIENRSYNLDRLGVI